MALSITTVGEQLTIEVTVAQPEHPEVREGGQPRGGNPAYERVVW